MKKLLESKILLTTTFFKDIPLVFWKFKLMYKLYFLNARCLKFSHFGTFDMLSISGIV